MNTRPTQTFIYKQNRLNKKKQINLLLAQKLMLLKKQNAINNINSKIISNRLADKIKNNCVLMNNNVLDLTETIVTDTNDLEAEVEAEVALENTDTTDLEVAAKLDTTDLEVALENTDTNTTDLEVAIEHTDTTDLEVASKLDSTGLAVALKNIDTNDLEIAAKLDIINNLASNNDIPINKNIYIANHVYLNKNIKIN